MKRKRPKKFVGDATFRLAALRIVERDLVQKMAEPWGRWSHVEFDRWATDLLWFVRRAMEV